MNSHTKVLLATDFSESAETLTDCLFALCPNIETEILLVHIVDDDNDANAQSKLETVAAKLYKACYTNVSLSLPILEGEIFQEIHELALSNNCDLVLVASHGKGFLRTTFMGSTTFDLARLSTYPLFIGSVYNEDGPQEPLLSKILIPTDFSKESLLALNFVRTLREHIEELVFVHVIERSRSSEELENKISLAKQKLSELVEEVKIFGVKSSYIIEKGSASKKLRKISEEFNVSLVVMAKTGGGLIKGLPLGSTSQNFALNTDRPLLLLPSMEEDD